MLDKRILTGYTLLMRIRSFSHKDLKRLYQEDNSKGFPADCVDKLRKMLAFMQDMQDVGEIYSLPTWRPHIMSGKRKGTWSLHVTPNWRLTFRIDAVEGEIYDVSYEDYH